MSWQVIEADCVEAMREMDADSIDAVVTDPPAGISFMSREWDHHKGGRDAWVAWLTSVLTECLRVAKPGAHALVWALPRTSHWTGWAIEGAGWEVRDRIAHHFGSGFPKSLNLGNGQGTALKPATEDWWLARKPLIGTVAQTVSEFGTGALNIDASRIQAQAGDREDYGLDGDEAAGIGYHGLEGRTAYERPAQGRWPPNVALSHLPSCERVGERRVRSGTAIYRNLPDEGGSPGNIEFKRSKRGDDQTYADPDGLETVEAWRCAPGCSVAELDRQSGERPGFSGGGPQAGRLKAPEVLDGGWVATGENNYYGDTGGASRFFATFSDEPCPIHGVCRCTICNPPRFRYTAKASRAERNAGLEGFEERPASERFRGERESSFSDPRMDREQERRPAKNGHPTVKPVDLMRWLCRLVTPPEGTILDPFAGSGTTGIAAVLEGFDFVGIEREHDYCEIAKARIAWWDTHKDRAEEILALSSKSERERAEHIDAGQLGLFGEQVKAEKAKALFADGTIRRCPEHGNGTRRNSNQYSCGCAIQYQRVA